MFKLEIVLQSQIERKLGLGIEQLRKWRQRYGFPPTETDITGGAVYSVKTVEKLILIKRLLEAGFKPRQIVAKSSDELKHLILDISNYRPEVERSDLSQRFIEILKNFFDCHKGIL